MSAPNSWIFKSVVLRSHATSAQPGRSPTVLQVYRKEEVLNEDTVFLRAKVESMWRERAALLEQIESLSREKSYLLEERELLCDQLECERASFGRVGSLADKWLRVNTCSSF